MGFLKSQAALQSSYTGTQKYNTGDNHRFVFVFISSTPQLYKYKLCSYEYVYVQTVKAKRKQKMYLFFFPLPPWRKWISVNAGQLFSFLPNHRGKRHQRLWKLCAFPLFSSRGRDGEHGVAPNNSQQMQLLTVLFVVHPGVAFFFFMVSLHERPLSFSLEEDETHFSSTYFAACFVFQTDGFSCD